MIDPAYMTTEHDRLMFRRAFEAARHIGSATALDGWRKDEILPGADVRTDAEIDAFIAKAAITHHHPVGTCRMGADAEAVVDPNLRLNGLDNVHIVDASVIPTITSGPVHAALLAIAETFAGNCR
jgi:pyridoxine 4-oxidase